MKAIVVFSMLMILAQVIGMPLMAGELTCTAEPSSSTPAYCPKCGCCNGLIPVCQPYCTTKKETKYHYCCRCKPMCIFDRCQRCDASGCDGPNWYQALIGCGASKCNCLTKEQSKLVKVPYTVETPVWKCKIEWVCPHCGCNCSRAVIGAESTQARGDLFPAPPLVPATAAPGIASNPSTCGVTSAYREAAKLRTPK